MMEVSKERSGWRDEELSERHRGYGWDCPAIDIDFLMIEYDTGKPIALVDYKRNGGTHIINLNHPSYQAMREIANAAQIPCFLAQYTTSPWQFKVTPINDLSVTLQAPILGRWVYEKEYVKHLYDLRNRTLPQELKLDDDWW